MWQVLFWHSTRFGFQTVRNDPDEFWFKFFLLEKDQCVDDCQGFMLECSKECNNDASCTKDCNREFAHCSDLCPCNKNCPDGCPCPHASEYCPTSTGIHILAFNPFPDNDDPLGADSRKQIRMSFSKNEYGAFAETVYDMSDKIDTPKGQDSIDFSNNLSDFRPIPGRSMGSW